MHVSSPSKSRSMLCRLIDEVSESHEPIEISGKGKSAILVSAGD